MAAHPGAHGARHRAVDRGGRPLQTGHGPLRARCLSRGCSTGRAPERFGRTAAGPLQSRRRADPRGTRRRHVGRGADRAATLLTVVSMGLGYARDPDRPTTTGGSAMARTGKVTVVGAGFYGSTTAQRLAEYDIFETVVLTDIIEGKPE